MLPLCLPVSLTFMAPLLWHFFNIPCAFRRTVVPTAAPSFEIPNYNPSLRRFVDSLANGA